MLLGTCKARYSNDDRDTPTSSPLPWLYKTVNLGWPMRTKQSTQHANSNKHRSNNKVTRVLG